MIVGHWLAYLAGLTDPMAWPYLLWSGIGAKVITAGWITLLWRKHRRTQREHHARIERLAERALVEGQHAATKPRTTPTR